MSYAVTFWGTRGSIPTSGPRTAHFGGNTPCLSLSRGNGHLVVLDAGTGLYDLGTDLMRRGDPVRADLLLSHTHWDHIQGLPFFKPLSMRGSRVRVWGARQHGVALSEILHRQMDPMFFPVPLSAFTASLNIMEIGTGSPDIDDFVVRGFGLRHPGTTLGYRLSPRGGGPDFAYVTDNELGAGGDYDVPADWRSRLIGFLRGVHTLVHDAMYSESIIRARAGWGHSTPRQAVDLAAEAGCRRLVLFHHDPEHDDGAIEGLLRDACDYARGPASGIEIVAAHDGLRLEL
jgi:phosphoribosyl 1,2-cyclic phosphodiesterase